MININYISNKFIGNFFLKKNVYINVRKQVRQERQSVSAS
jgi:hypothetical protein